MWWLEREATVRGRDPQIHPCNDRRSVKHSGNLVTAAKLDLKGYCKEIHPQVGGGIVGRVGKLFLVLNASSGHNNNLNNENNKDILLNYSKHKFHLEIRFPNNGWVNHSFSVRRPPQRAYFLLTRKVKVHSGGGDWRSGPEQLFQPGKPKPTVTTVELPPTAWYILWWSVVKCSGCHHVCSQLFGKRFSRAWTAWTDGGSSEDGAFCRVYWDILETLLCTLKLTLVDEAIYE